MTMQDAIALGGVWISTKQPCALDSGRAAYV